MVDLHYSDTWADPGNQWKPAAWANHGIQQLQKDVYDYTYGVCTTLKAQGTTPDSIQIGNEINVGMLWNEGKVANNNFTNLGLLLKSGYNAVKACSSSTQVIIHTANSDSTDHLKWFYDGITNQGVTWDITGLSYYCFWHGGLDALYSAVSTAAHPVRQAGRPRRDRLPVHHRERGLAGEQRQRHLRGLRRELDQPGDDVPVHPEHRPERGRRSASSTGSRPGPPCRATAGTRTT